MVCSKTLALALLQLTASVVTAYPGSGAGSHGRNAPRHRHHRRVAPDAAGLAGAAAPAVAKRGDDDDAMVVYETVMVTEFVTYTQTSDAAGQPTTSAVTIDALTTAAVTATTSPAAALAALTATAGSATPLLAAQLVKAADPTTLATATQNTAAAAVATTTSPAATTMAPTTTPVTAPHTSSTLAATTTTGSSGSSTLKRGLAWPSENAVSAGSVFAGHASSLGWYHNWGTGSTSSLSAIPFVYTQWGSDNTANLAALPHGSILVGPNEPDQSAQANMSPSVVAALYRAHLTPLRQSGQVSRLGSPACSNTDAGLAWLKSFLAQCADCQVDFITQHWYGPSVSMLQSQLAAVHALDTSKPVWLTEFACTNWAVATNPTADAISAFMRDSTNWLDAQGWVEKYAWFGALHITDAALGAANMLVSNDLGSLSSLGRQYLGLA